MFAQPVDGALQAVLQRDLRLPAEQRACQRVVGQQALDLAFFRAAVACSSEMTLIGLPESRPMTPTRSPMLISRPEPRLIVSPMASFGRAAREKAVDRVGDVIEIARRMQIAQADALAGQALRDDRGNDGARRLPRAEGVERAAPSPTGTPKEQ